MAGKKSEVVAERSLPFAVKADGQYFVYADVRKLYLSGSEVLNQWPSLEPTLLKVEDCETRDDKTGGLKILFGE